MSTETNKQTCYNYCVHRLLQRERLFLYTKLLFVYLNAAIKTIAFQEMNNTPDNGWLLQAPDWLNQHVMRWSECSLQCCL